MFNCGDTCRDGAPRPFRARGMRRRRPAARRGRFNNKAQLGLGERRPRLAVRAPSIIGVDFYDIGAGADLSAGLRDKIVDPSSLDRTLRYIDGFSKSLGSVGSLSDNRGSRDDEARPIDQSLRERFLQPDIGIACALGPEIADRRETGQQCRAQVN